MNKERLGMVLRYRDKAVVKRLAELEGESIACVVRRLTRKEAKRRGLWLVDNKQEVLHEK